MKISSRAQIYYKLMCHSLSLLDDGMLNGHMISSRSSATAAAGVHVDITVI